MVKVVRLASSAGALSSALGMSAIGGFMHPEEDHQSSGHLTPALQVSVLRVIIGVLLLTSSSYCSCAASCHARAPSAPNEHYQDQFRRRAASPRRRTPGEMIAATGWLPHTTRAVLMGLRKKGHAIERARRGEVTIGRIGGEA